MWCKTLVLRKDKVTHCLGCPQFNRWCTAGDYGSKISGKIGNVSVTKSFRKITSNLITPEKQVDEFLPRCCNHNETVKFTHCEYVSLGLLYLLFEIKLYVSLFYCCTELMYEGNHSGNEARDGHTLHTKIFALKYH